MSRDHDGGRAHALPASAPGACSSSQGALHSGLGAGQGVQLSPRDAHNTVPHDDASQLDVILYLQRELQLEQARREAEQQAVLQRMAGLERKEMELLHFMDQSKRELHLNSDLLQKARAGADDWGLGSCGCDA